VKKVRETWPISLTKLPLSPTLPGEWAVPPETAGRESKVVWRDAQLFTRSNDGFGSRALFCGRDQRSQLTHIRNLSAQISKEFEEEFLLAASLILRGNVAPDPAIRDTERIMAASRMPAPLR
jgi:hypothetical protein